MVAAKPLVLLAETAPRTTGSVRSLASAVGELKGSFEFVLAGPSRDVANTIGVPWERFDFVTPRRRELLSFGPRVLAEGIAFGRLVRRLGAQLVHVNDFMNLVPIAARWMGSRYPLVYHVRLLPTSYLGPIFRPLSRVVVDNADRIVCVSRAVQDALPVSSRVALVPNGLPVRVINDGVRVPASSTDDARARDGLEIVYVGHFHPGKGHDLAVEAFARARARVPTMRLRFVGDEAVDRAFSQRVRERVAALDQQDAIFFQGPVPSTEPYVRAADVVLNLSESESFSMVVLEAMMLGRAVVASRCGGPEELLSEPGSGVLVDNRDVDAAARELVTLATDPEARRVMGREARRVATSRFDVQRTARLLEEVYREAMQLAPRRRRFLWGHR